MNISIDGIPNGSWRYLSDEEVQEILSLSESSSKTEEASKNDAKGRRIVKATDAKLFDSREENQTSKARRNPRTFKGRDADKFRHAPRKSNAQNTNTRKPQDRVGGTLSLKK
jgi:23S rRNA pseudouridine2604 synthase